MDFRKVRRFLERSQLWVSLQTGVSVRTISAAEREEYVHPHDRAVLERFYGELLRDFEECERRRRAEQSKSTIVAASPVLKNKFVH